MTSQNPNLADLGWTAFFRSQISADELSQLLPVRVVAVHRGLLRVMGECGEQAIRSYMPDAQSEEDYPTVGDWLLLDRQSLQPKRILRRASLFERRAAGTERKLQLIAANVDTLFIVSSCNQDFSIARLERYLVLAREADVTPVIVLTKADLSDAPEDYAKAARALQPGLLAETVNALDAGSLSKIRPWCGTGQTVALLGSSGVGKSTLVNTLTNRDATLTQAIREDDDKGRHTTTARCLHRLKDGGWLLDTPGMRELQLVDVSTGVESVFDDVMALARHCRFSDCQHQTEPGCAVMSAVESGILDPKRLKRWRKLAAEEAHNTETLAERRARERTFGKYMRSVTKAKRRETWE